MRYLRVFASIGFVVATMGGCDVVYQLERPPADSVRWKVVSAGRAHTCAIDTEAGLWCWGENGRGQISADLELEFLAPTRVDDQQRFIAVSAGYEHTCAIDEEQRLWCWGSNSYGESGGSRVVANLGSTRVLETESVITVSAGVFFTCAVTSAGNLYCWGYNAYGQVGNPAADPVRNTVPLQVGAGTVWTAVNVGNYHACGLAGDELWCWGLNGSFQVDETTGSKTTPISRGAGWKAVAGGDAHTCGLRLDGTVACWGGNTSGQLGAPGAGPIKLGAEGWTSIVAGEQRTCGVRDDDSLWCWGANGQNQLADLVGSESAPRRISGRWQGVALGSRHLCALDDAGALRCAGNGASGQLGDGAGGSVLLPTPVQSDLTWADVDAGGSTTCGRATDKVHCWGYNGVYQLGDDTTTSVQGPKVVDVASGSTTVVSVGYAHACAATDSTTYCWGDNRHGEAGVLSPAYARTPVVVNSTMAFQQLTLGTAASCGLAGTSLVCWGSNDSGQQHQPPSAAKTPPTSIAGAWKRASMGRTFACGIQTTDDVYCWGFSNSPNHPALGGADSSGKVDLAARDISVGGQHACAIRTDGGLSCWGTNTSGQVGDGTQTNRSRPTSITGAQPASISMGDDHGCFVATDGALFCWGANRRGQLGVGDRVDRRMPSRVGNGTWASITCGDSHTCGITTDGRAFCWGANGYGQLGSDAWSSTLVPVVEPTRR